VEHFVKRSSVFRNSTGAPCVLSPWRHINLHGVLPLVDCFDVDDNCDNSFKYSLQLLTHISRWIGLSVKHILCPDNKRGFLTYQCLKFCISPILTGLRPLQFSQFISFSSRKWFTILNTSNDVVLPSVIFENKISSSISFFNPHRTLVIKWPYLITSVSSFNFNALREVPCLLIVWNISIFFFLQC